MLYTPHFLTGAVILKYIPNPAVGLPLAFLSHFVLDAIPHGAVDGSYNGSRRFAQYLIADASLCGLLVLLIMINRPSDWLVASACAFLAASPDFMWARGYLRARKGIKTQLKPKYALARFHSWVQWYQHPSGWAVEATWAVGAVALLVKLI